MSTRSKLQALTAALEIPPDDTGHPTPAPGPAPGPAPAFPAAVPGVAARTGPGLTAQFRGQILAAEGEMSRLRERLKEHEGSIPARKLDPADVQPSRWANRHPDAFLAPQFESLKQDIAQAGGNIQPILVRPLKGSGQTPPGAKYEVVFGHRRHRACLELGLPVLAVIDADVMSDRDLFAAMDRENRERADLSPFEQGQMYKQALEAGLYPSNRRLAEALGVSHTWVSNVLAVADLPAAIVECFRSPLEIQHRHAKAIAEAMSKDRKAVLRRAEKLRQAPRVAPGAVVEALTTLAGTAESSRRTVVAGGKEVGSWRLDGKGRVVIELAAGIVAPEKVEDLLRKLLEADS